MIHMINRGYIWMDGTDNVKISLRLSRAFHHSHSSGLMRCLGALQISFVNSPGTIFVTTEKVD